MKDDELVAAFEGGWLEPAAFRHREHVRVAWVLLQRYGRDGAEERLAGGIRALAARAGRPEKYDGALTRAWVERIDQVRAARPDLTTFAALEAGRPDLLDPRRVP